jgi:hypothetical protein
MALPLNLFPLLLLSLLLLILQQHGVVESSNHVVGVLSTQLGLTNTNDPDLLLSRPTQGILLVLETATKLTSQELDKYSNLKNNIGTKNSEHYYVNSFTAIRSELDPFQVKNVFPQANMVTISSLGSVSDDFAEATGRVSYPNVWRFENQELNHFITYTKSNKDLVDAHVVVFKEGASRLEAELALFQELVVDVSSRDNSAGTDNHHHHLHHQPRIMIVSLTIDDNVLSRDAALMKINNMINACTKSSTRVAMEIVLVAEKSNVRRILEVPKTRARRDLARARLKGPLPPFTGFDYVTMFWVIVCGIFILFFVMVCIPWSQPLDAELMATLSTGSEKKED